ncbi:MAG TPA: hypothetical protein VGT41_06530 [Candidatus Babeliales bacterium]|nr:hypothetical protein [Candidatus Babeliales bacterium]
MVFFMILAFAIQMVGELGGLSSTIRVEDPERVADERVTSFIDACMKGQLYADERFLKYMGGKRQHGIRVDEIKHVLRDYEAKYAAGELSEGRLKKAIYKWKIFKNCDDLRGKIDKDSEKVINNRQNLLDAINSAKNFFEAIDGQHDAIKVEQASKKKLFLRYPLIVRWKRFVQ